MRPTRGIVHRRGSRLTSRQAIVENFFTLGHADDLNLCAVIDDYFASLLFYFQLLDRLARRQKQIAQVIQIELDHVTLQLHPEVGHLTDDVKHLHDGARSQTRIFFITLDSEGLS